jgi:hypothetical protein
MNSPQFAALPLTLCALVNSIGCVDLSAGPDVIQHADNCTHIQQLLEAGQLQPGTRYSGEHGFSFEAFDAAGASADGVETCAGLEAALAQLTAAGVPGTALSYWSTHVRIRAARGQACARRLCRRGRARLSRTTCRKSPIASSTPTA